MISSNKHTKDKERVTEDEISFIQRIGKQRNL